MTALMVCATGAVLKPPWSVTTSCTRYWPGTSGVIERVELDAVAAVTALADGLETSVHA